MAEPLTFQALASSDYVLSSAENYILYVCSKRLRRAVAAVAMARACRSISAS